MEVRARETAVEATESKRMKTRILTKNSETEMEVEERRL